MLPGLTRDQARRLFFIYLGFSILGLLSVGIALAIRYWVLAVFGAAILLQTAVWLKNSYAVGWPDSRPLFPFGFFLSLSRKQRALVEFGIGIFLVIAVVLSQPSVFGFALGAVILVGTLLAFILTLRGRGWSAG